MEQAIDYKVPGGKLIRIRASLREGIEDITINGDFFIHPEEKITSLEAALIGSSLEERDISFRIYWALEGARLFGVTQKAFLDALLKLKENA